MHVVPEIGRYMCPRCGGYTYRIRSPWYLRPLRWALPHRSSTRCCLECGWIGFKLGRSHHGSHRHERHSGGGRAA